VQRQNRALQFPTMKRLLFAFMLSPSVVLAQPPPTSPGPEFSAVLNFEMEHTGTMPRGWAGGPPETISVDGAIVHGGRWAVRLERSATSPQAFSTITTVIPIDFQGQTLEWRGFLRTESVSAFVGLWMREDGVVGSVAFDNMQQRQVNGTRDWTNYSITLPLRPNARTLAFGVLVAGTGTVWADDLQLLVDGKPVWEAPKVERPKTALDLDHDFDLASGIAVSGLSAMQTQNLSTLGKVWGFLKYHHPAVTAGKRHWDYELFRVMPKVLAARDRESANTVLRDWVQSLGDVPPCTSCTTLRTDDLHLEPDIGWIDRQALLGSDLAALLRTVYNRRTPGPQFYLSLAPNVGNPSFENEPTPAISFWRCSVSGTPSNIGPRTGTSWITIGTRCWLSSSRESRPRQPRTSTSSRCLRSSRASPTPTRTCGVPHRSPDLLPARANSPCRRASSKIRP